MKILRIALPLLLTGLILCLTSCDKVPANGCLDGTWQLVSIERSDTIIDAKPSQKYISFQLGLIQLRQASLEYEDYTRYYGHFSKNGDEMRFYDLCLPSDNTTSSDDDRPFTEANISMLNGWGIYHTDNTFHIDTLNSRRMVLSNSETTLRFRKY